MNLSDLKDSGAAVLGGAVSGGLDSCTVTHWLKENGFATHSYTVDLGQPDEESLDAVADRMLACGPTQRQSFPERSNSLKAA